MQSARELVRETQRGRDLAQSPRSVPRDDARQDLGAHPSLSPALRGSRRSANPRGSPAPGLASTVTQRRVLDCPPFHAAARTEH